MFETRLLKSSHRVSRDQFEIILAIVEEATNDPKMIVDVGRGKILQRSQPRVEFPMVDGVDRSLPNLATRRLSTILTWE